MSERNSRRLVDSEILDSSTDRALTKIKKNYKKKKKKTALEIALMLFMVIEDWQFTATISQLKIGINELLSPERF